MIPAPENLEKHPLGGASSRVLRARFCYYLDRGQAETLLGRSRRTPPAGGLLCGFGICSSWWHALLRQPLLVLAHPLYSHHPRRLARGRASEKIDWSQRVPDSHSDGRTAREFGDGSMPGGGVFPSCAIRLGRSEQRRDVVRNRTGMGMLFRLDTPTNRRGSSDVSCALTSPALTDLLPIGRRRRCVCRFAPVGRGR